MSAAAERILVAGGHLDRGELAEALDVFGDRPGPDDVAGESIWLTARGLILEREGNVAEADSYLQRAFAQGAPLPAVLAQCGRYFKRTGQYQRAYCCYSVLQSFKPRAINQFLRGLPPEELVRYSPRLVRQLLLTGRRPGFYALQPVKEALARQLGPDAAAMTFADMAGYELGDITRAPLTSLKDFAAAEALRYEELSSSRTTYLPPPPEFGSPPVDGIEARTRAMFVCVLENVVVSSKSNFLLAGGRALLDYQHDELETIPQDLDVDPIVFAPTADEVTAFVEAGAVEGPPLAEALTLLGLHSYNFGHWLVEFLPRLWACLGRPGFDSVPILIDEQMVPQHREAVQLLVGSAHPIVVVRPGQALRVKKLWTGATPTHHPLGPKPAESDTDEIPAIDGEMFATLVERVRPMLEASEQPSGPKRVYLTREDSQHRKLVNRTEVESWFVARDFEVFNFGDLPFAQQLQRIRGADVVVGPDGSALWLTFLARPGTSVGFLNNPYLEEHWWIASLCESLGHRLSILTGEVVREHPAYRKFSDYRIEINALPGFLDELLSAP